MNTTLRRAITNLGLLFGIVVPVWTALTWTIARLTGGPQDSIVGALAYYFLTFAVPLLIGGVAQQLLLLLVPRHWSRLKQRLCALGTTLTIPVAFLIVGSDAGLLLSAPVLLPLLLGMLLYGWFARVPLLATGHS